MSARLVMTACALLAALANPAMAQDHSGHDMDHGAMDHSAMDHAAMGHGADAAPAPVLPAPPAAGSGPARAADAVWSAEAMRDSRAALRRDHGAMPQSGLLVDRFEYRARQSADGYLWNAKAWYGGDLNRVWLESEGEGSFDHGIESASVAALYGHTINPWFDLRAGVKQDLTGPKRTYLNLGIEGLAPYRFEVSADLSVSNKGDVTAAAEVELDQRITQRLILQPHAEIALSAQDVPELGIGSGLTAIETGVRLRYEIAREFAPYLGVVQEWKLGKSADYARTAGEDPGVTSFVAGIRFWF